MTLVLTSKVEKSLLKRQPKGAMAAPFHFPTSEVPHRRISILSSPSGTKRGI